MRSLAVLLVVLVSVCVPPSAIAFLAVGSSLHGKRHEISQPRLLLFMGEPSVPNFCADCGSAAMVLKIPPGDERLRACCDHCGRIEYQNPKIVASCVVRCPQGKVLLAKRAIEPRRGTWGIPQGFMEHGETSLQAAAREVYEETGVVVDP